MKHILIILISILLLSSPVIGEETGELFKWETSSEVYQWKTFGDVDFHTKYKGEIRNGKPNGFGIMYFINGNKTVGEWKNGKEWNTKHHRKDGKPIEFYENGKKSGEKQWTKLLGTSHSECGKEVKENAVVCIHCGVATGTGHGTQVNIGDSDNGVSDKEWLVTLLLSFFLGILGIHRFYTGHTAIGVAQLLTFGGCGIWAFIDFIMIIVGSFKDAEGRSLKK